MIVALAIGAPKQAGASYPTARGPRHLVARLRLRDTGRAMSQENVEVVRRAWEYEIFGRGGGDDPLATSRRMSS